MSINITEEMTVIIPTISSTIAVPTLNFPRFYIVVPAGATQRGKEQRRAVYCFETAPDRIFDAWLRSFSNRGISIFQRNKRWPLAERYKEVSKLAERDIVIPWFLSYDAACAAAKEVQG